jgi:hypothetical protein
MKMGTIALPWRYDAVTRRALQIGKIAIAYDFGLCVIGQPDFQNRGGLNPEENRRDGQKRRIGHARKR